MTIFLDANVLVSVLNKEYPSFTYTSRILSLAGTPPYQVYTSPICLAIAFYFAEKKSGTRLAQQKIALLSSKVEIADNTAGGVRKAAGNVKIHDFEDGLEYYAASEAKCTCIITQDVDDFYFSEIEVLSPQNFFKKYLAGKN